MVVFMTPSTISNNSFIAVTQILSIDIIVFSFLATELRSDISHKTAWLHDTWGNYLGKSDKRI